MLPALDEEILYRFSIGPPIMVCDTMVKKGESEELGPDSDQQT